MIHPRDKLNILGVLSALGGGTAKPDEPCFDVLEKLRDDSFVTRSGPCNDGLTYYQITPEGKAELERLCEELHI